MHKCSLCEKERKIVAERIFWYPYQGSRSIVISICSICIDEMKEELEEKREEDDGNNKKQNIRYSPRHQQKLDKINRGNDAIW
tara:strand:- start:33 stop:281 length:249 start_codon:yes stop_codon:yes gene_type:complete